MEVNIKQDIDVEVTEDEVIVRVKKTKPTINNDKEE